MFSCQVESTLLKQANCHACESTKTTMHKLNTSTHNVHSNLMAMMVFYRKADQQIIGQLDQLVTEQQSTLSQAAVPCFTVTTDPTKIKLQMSVLTLIAQLAPN